MISDINNFLLLVEKIFAVLGALIYFVFSLVIVKQVTSMSSNVYDKFNSILIAFSYIHLAFSVFLIVLTLIAG